MKWSLVFVLISICTAAHASDWYKLGVLNDGIVVLIDRSSVVTKNLMAMNGNYSSVRAGWVKFLNPKPVKKVLTTQQFMDVSCDTDAWSAYSIIQYDSKGSVLSSWTAPLELVPTTPVPPDTGIEVIRDYFCNSK